MSVNELHTGCPLFILVLLAYLFRLCFQKISLAGRKDEDSRGGEIFGSDAIGEKISHEFPMMLFEVVDGYSLILKVEFAHSVVFVGQHGYGVKLASLKYFFEFIVVVV